MNIKDDDEVSAVAPVMESEAEDAADAAPDESSNGDAASSQVTMEIHDAPEGADLSDNGGPDTDAFG